MNKQKRKRDAPVLFYGHVPEAQLAALQLVGHALDNLAYFSDCFAADLRLFDKCAKELKLARGRRRDDLRNWQFVAARDGAMNVYHFSEAIKSLTQSLHECSHVKGNLKYDLIKTAEKLFDTHFPNAKRLRHSVGHAAEKASNSKAHKEHGYTGLFKLDQSKPVRVRHFIAIDVLNRRKYSNTWRGRIESYSISKATFRRLLAVRDSIFDAFEEMNLRLREVW